MPGTRNSPLDKILDQLDKLDKTNLQILVRRLAKERRLFEGIFNTIREGILLINKQGVVEYANDEGCKIVGLRESDIGSAVLWKWIPNLAPAINLDEVEEDQAATMLSREIEINYPQHRFVRVYMVPYSELGEVGEDEHSNYVVILLDITQEKTSTEEKIESEKVSSILLLAAGVAHELGNPLNSLTIHLQLMRRQLVKMSDDLAKDKIAKSLDICSGEVDRLDGIISNFLQAIRPSPPDFRDVNLINVVEDVLLVQGRELESFGIEAEVQIGEETPIISGDTNQLKQVFFNVVKNAREAMQPGGQLRIRSRSDDDFFYILFADTGKGIDQQDLANVFKPYYSTKKSGSGLGMMIVNRILRDHGGQVGIDSQPGVGTVITLQFPKKHRRVRLLPES